MAHRILWADILLGFCCSFVACRCIFSFFFEATFRHIPLNWAFDALARKQLNSNTKKSNNKWQEVKIPSLNCKLYACVVVVVGRFFFATQPKSNSIQSVVTIYVCARFCHSFFRPFCFHWPFSSFSFNLVFLCVSSRVIFFSYVMFPFC